MGRYSCCQSCSPRIWHVHNARYRENQSHLVNEYCEHKPPIESNYGMQQLTPTQLNIDPVLAGSGSIKNVLRVGQERWPGHVPFVRGEEQDVGARRVHLVGFTRMNRLFLDSLDLQRLELLIEHLTQIHDHRLVTVGSAVKVS